MATSDAEGGEPRRRPAAGRGARVLFVVNDPAFFMSHRALLAARLALDGYRVAIAAPPLPGSDDVERAGFPYHPFALDRTGTNALREIAVVGELARLFRRVRPDLVHLVSVKPIVYGGLAARLAHVPAAVFSVSGLGYLFVSDSRRAAALRVATLPLYRAAVAHRNGRLVFQNPDDLELFVRLRICASRDGVVVGGSGLDLARYRAGPPPAGPPLVVLPARMLWTKGVREFVEAAGILRRGGVVARFALVGAADPGKLDAIPLAQLRAWVREGLVEWWGHRSDMADVLRAASIVCLPSHREGFSRALMEAAASGRPAVTCDVPGCRDAVAPGQSALLVPPRDAPSLARAVADLLGDRARWGRMAHAARSLAIERFGVAAAARSTAAIYADLLGGSPAGPTAETRG
jgi:glycosyltransferase involved in cell wall biosynthesis